MIHKSMESDFHKKLKAKVHGFVLLVYDLTEKFPKSELFGTVSQLRRAAVSIMLNYGEGFARLRPKVKLQFWETSFGSSKECQYLVFLALEKKWISKIDYDKAFKLVDESSGMLWKTIQGLSNIINKDNL